MLTIPCSTHFKVSRLWIYVLRCLIISGFILLFATLQAQVKGKVSFKVVPLGVKGGLDESNLSAYLIAPSGTNNYICVDAGTIRSGIDKAIG
ncbi:MAG TPA: hypothetical protein VF610_09205, partial [Segetibacter sp.]